VQIIHDDKDADLSGDSFCLVRLNSGCHVVAKSYSLWSPTQTKIGA